MLTGGLHTRLEGAHSISTLEKFLQNISGLYRLMALETMICHFNLGITFPFFLYNGFLEIVLRPC